METCCEKRKDVLGTFAGSQRDHDAESNQLHEVQDLLA